MGDDDPAVTAFIARAPRWRDEMTVLRVTLRGCGLGETIKWGKPTFTVEAGNIAIFQPMTAFLSVLFFKGRLMADPDGLLRSQGPNTRSALRIEVAGPDAARALEPALRHCVAEAVRIEAAGLRVPPRAPGDLVPVPELDARLADDAVLREAFAALTPGRQRGWTLHFAAARQSATRAARVERSIPRILDGFGPNDR